MKNDSFHVLLNNQPNQNTVLLSWERLSVWQTYYFLSYVNYSG